VIDKSVSTDRRRFLSGSAGAAAFVAAGPALAQLKTGPASAAPTLARMARDLYPHDRLPDAAYAAAVAAIDGQFADDPSRGLSMARGAQELDNAAQALSGRPYLAIDGEAGRVAVLKSMEQAGSAFFKAMRAGMITTLYNQEGLWPKFGYEGSSAEKGGYLHRGFDDLDWLPA
jgi:hypothetical protein